MTTYNTGNPIGSTAAKDFYDNVENYDVALNSTTQDVWTDRLGQQRRTWNGLEGMVSDAAGAYGYIILNGYSFQTGATVNLNELLLDEDSGEYFKWTGAFPVGGLVVPAGSTPVGSEGPGEWKSVGDASARQWALQTFYSTGLTVSYASIGSSIVSGTDAVFISGTTYPLSVPVTGSVTEINLTIKPYYIVAGGVKSHLLDINWFRKGEIHARSYWAAGDGVTSDSPCFQAMFDDIPTIADDIPAVKVHLDAPDIAYALGRPIYLWELDYLNVVGDGAMVTKFTLLNGMNTTPPQEFIDSQASTGKVYTGVKAGFIIAARRNIQAPSQGYIASGLAPWGMKFNGFSIDAQGDAIYTAYGIYAPKLGIGKISDYRSTLTRFGFYSGDCYLYHFENCQFLECRSPMQIDGGTSIVMTNVSASKCTFGYRIRSQYMTMNCVTNDHWGLNQDGTVATNSYAYDLIGNIVMNGCAVEIGYGGVLKVGAGLDDSNTTESHITLNGCNFISGAHYTQSNWLDQNTLADFGVAAWGYAVFSYCKVNWDTITLKNAVEDASTIRIRFPVRFVNSSQLSCNSFTGNTNRYVDITDLEVDTTSRISCTGVMQKTLVRAEIDSNLIVAANNRAAVAITEVIDVINNYGAGIFTVPCTGYYRVNFSVAYNGSGLSYIAVSNLTTGKNAIMINDSGLTAGSLTINQVMYMKKNDSVRFVVRTGARAVTIYSGSHLAIEML